MKLQSLAILFVIIILPIAIIIGEYARTQIEIFRLEQLYDSRLITATDDALDAFQINTFNDAASDIADSKINSIEASANAFFNSMESNFGLQGYAKQDLLQYVPALIYTMYDGYYIYSPYSNVAKTGEEEGLKIDLETEETDYGFKPYIYYSCRYVKDDIDVIINYSLDNYITVQGIINGQSVYKSGYLLTIASERTGAGVYRDEINGAYYYNGLEISIESRLTDYLVEEDGLKPYAYIKINGTKYYWDEDEKYIFYLMGGKRVQQATEANNSGLYEKYTELIVNNTSAINYYKSAWEFYDWMKNGEGQGLLELELRNAKTDVGLSGKAGDKIFNNENIEYENSNFNLHRKEVIRYSIESNLSVAIANFNKYTNSGTNFQMPKLKETEWELLQNEVSIISFLQGLNLGGKIYNGYTVVTNNKTKEVVKEENIYIATEDGYYHKITDKHLLDGDEDYTSEPSIGVLNLDFEIRKDGATGVNYTQKKGLGCYISIVGQENNNDCDCIYKYLSNPDIEISDEIKRIYYTALGRERWGDFKIETKSNVQEILENMTGNIIEDKIPAVDYGAYVENYTASNGTNDELGIGGWRIFYSEGDSVYLISDDYVSRASIPKIDQELDIGTGHKSFYLTNVIKEYEGETRSIKARNYLLDKEAWSGFKDENGYAEYAIGAPELELFVASYNKTHPERTIDMQQSGKGYNLKWSTQDTYTKDLTELEKDTGLLKDLYVKVSKKDANGKRDALGVWFATPDVNRGDYLRRIYGYGYTINTGHCPSDGDDSVRPIVRLKEGITLEKQANGNYKIVE